MLAMSSRGQLSGHRPNWLPAVGGVWPRFVARCYREVAGSAAALLGSSEIVRSVLVHRSVAAGEVTLGFSDIDLIVIVREPRSESMDGPELLDLYERVRRLRRIIPRLGQIEIHDPRGFQSWFHLDTFRGSQERRSATLLCGEPVEMPEVSVRREDALRRFALSPYYFLPPAIVRQGRRSLRNIALEMWGACATATGLVTEPFLTRRATEEYCRSQPDGCIPGDLKRARSAQTFLFRTAEELHRRLLPPLARIREPILEGVPLRPGAKARPVVVLPRPDSPLPDVKLDPVMSFFTPELLDLCIQFALPYLYWTLSPALLDLGIRQPTSAAFLQYARYYTHSVMLRVPGFGAGNATYPFALNVRTAHIARHLERGEIPTAPDAEGCARTPSLSIAEYYRSAYPGLLVEYQERAMLLSALEGPAETTATRPPVGN
jgi:predicted nucleotidyltransferase